MDTVVKFIVITPINAEWIRKTAEKQLIATYKTADDLTTAQQKILPAFSDHSLIWGQNDFSKEMLMAFKGEEPLASFRFVSNQPKAKDIVANKPIYLDMVVHNFSEDGLSALILRATQIAQQRKYDLLWVEIPGEDTFSINTFSANGFELTESDTAAKDEYTNTLLYIKKV